MTISDISTYDIDKDRGVRIQKFFCGGILWLRLVVVVNGKVDIFTFWSMESNVARKSWLDVVKAVSEAVHSMSDFTGSELRKLMIYPDGWGYWGFGIPKIVCDSDVNYELDNKAINDPIRFV